MLLLMPVLDDKCYMALHNKIVLYHILDEVAKYKSEISCITFVCNKDIEKLQDYVYSYYENDYFIKNKCKFIYTSNDSILNALYLGLHNYDVVEPVLFWSGSELCINPEVIFSTKKSYRGIYKDLYVDIYMFKNFNLVKNTSSSLPVDMNDVCNIYNKVENIVEEELIDYVPLGSQKEIVEAVNYFIKNDEDSIFQIEIDEDNNYIEKVLKDSSDKDSMEILYLEKEFYNNTEYNFCPRVIEYDVGFKPEQVLSMKLKKVSGIPLSTLLYTDYDCEGLGNKIFSCLEVLHNKESKESVPYSTREKYIYDMKLYVDYCIDNLNIMDEEKKYKKNLNELYYKKYKSDLENLVIYNIDNHVFGNLSIKNILVDVNNNEVYFINPRTRLNQVGFVLDDYIDIFLSLGDIDKIVDVDVIKEEMYSRIDFNKEMLDLGVELRRLCDASDRQREAFCCV